jgi:hypothetical protein
MSDEPSQAHGGPLDGCEVESDRPTFFAITAPDRMAFYDRQPDGSYRYAMTATRSMIASVLRKMERDAEPGRKTAMAFRPLVFGYAVAFVGCGFVGGWERLVSLAPSAWYVPIGLILITSVIVETWKKPRKIGSNILSGLVGWAISPLLFPALCFRRVAARFNAVMS